MNSVERLNRGHVAGCLAIGVLGVICAAGSLSPQQKSGSSLIGSLFAAAIGGGAFASAIYFSQIVEEAERVEERFRRQQEDVAFAENQALANARVQKLQLQAGAKLQVDELIAQDEAQQYYADHLGVPLDALCEVEEEEAEDTQKAKPAQPSQVVVESPKVEVSTPQPIVNPIPQPVPESILQPAELIQPNLSQPTASAQPVLQKGICQALDEIVVTDISTVFASATGTGKSVSEAYILNRMFAKFPNMEAWAIAQKNDSFCGLRERGRTALFDPLDPLAAFAAINEVYSIFDQRRRTPESARSGFKNQPVRLILSDWHSIWDTCREEKWYKSDYSKKLSTLVTVGREMNVCLLVDTQSYNVASLGITEDANIRSNLNILCQGYTWIDEQGRQRGDFNMIRNLLKNRYLVPVDSDQLITDLEKLKIKSMEVKTPIIFSTIGSKLQLLPDLKSFKAIA